MNIKQLFLDTDKIEPGDLVISKNETRVYFVVGIGYTILHGHKFLKIIETDGENDTLIINNMEPEKRKVIRLVK